jgi:hypothetical protein
MYEDNEDYDAPNGRITFSANNPKKDVHRECELRIRERMSRDHKLTYTESMRAVFNADVELHRAYLDAAPPLKITNR